MKHRIVLALVLILSGTILSAEKPQNSRRYRPMNNIYLNIIGVDVSMVSLNYERLFLYKSDFFLAGGLGIGYNKVILFSKQERYFPEIKSYGDYLTIPHHITINFGHNESLFEIGIGGTAVSGNGAPQNYYLYPIIGYRYHPLRSQKVTFRAYASFPIDCIENMGHIINDKTNYGLWWFFIGVSLGVGF